MYTQVSASIGAEQIAFFIRDSIRNALRVLNLIKADDPAALAEFDRIAARAKAEGRNLLEVACEADASPLSTHMAAILVTIILAHWMEGELFADYDWSLELVRMSWEQEKAAKDEEKQILRGVLNALVPMAEVRDDPLQSAPAINETARAFFDLAEALEHKEKWHPAFGCAQSATHFFQAVGDWVSTEAAAAACLRLAKRLENPRFIAGELERSAHLLCQRASENGERQKDAFDALETALRYLATRPELAEQHGKIVRSWVKQSRDFQLLQPLVLATLPRVQWPAPPEGLEIKEVEDVVLAVRPIWDVEFEALRSRLYAIRPWINEVEDRRLEWDPISKTKTTVATASWAAFAFSHPHTRRAIPHSKSILKEVNRHNLLLDLAHETTHVYSVLGSVGLAAWAMRSGFVELETRLWSTTVEPDDEVSPLRWARTRRPANLRAISERGLDTVTADLARVEQELEVERKIQLVERLWAPWFEGLAVFGEHAADPRADPDSYSPVVGVVSNLFDTAIGKEAKEQGISRQEAIQRRQARAETLLGEAQEHEGVNRLIGYFGSAQHTKYLAGYLAVRSVVAAWRAQLDKPLSGAEAFAMLLHATRYSGSELVPPSDLPLAEFREQLLERQLRWLREISTVPKEDLAQLNAAYARLNEESGFVWIDGRIKSVLESSPEAQQYNQRLLQRVADTRLSLTGARAAPDRVSGASVECRVLMVRSAELLEEMAPEAAMIDEEMLNAMLAAVSVLPIGQVQAPYWLNLSNSLFTYWIRTRECDAEHGRPSYNVTSENLPEIDFRELEKRVKLGAPSRAKVTRIAYLTDPKHQLLQGTNYLAFQIDDWFWIRNGGMLFESPNVPSEVEDAAQRRLDPHPFQTMQEAFLDSDDHPCATRSRDWLGEDKWQFPFENQEIDLTPWADHVQKMATEILQTKETDDFSPANRALYEFVFGDAELAAQLCGEGLDFLHRDPELELVVRLIQELHHGGRLPLSGESSASLAEQLTKAGLPAFEQTSHGWDVVRPAFMRKRSTDL